jgi:hypothetical protein
VYATLADNAHHLTVHRRQLLLWLTPIAIGTEEKIIGAIMVFGMTTTLTKVHVLETMTIMPTVKANAGNTMTGWAIHLTDLLTKNLDIKNYRDMMHITDSTTALSQAPMVKTGDLKSALSQANLALTSFSWASTRILTKLISRLIYRAMDAALRQSL